MSKNIFKTHKSLEPHRPLVVALSEALAKKFPEEVEAMRQDRFESHVARRARKALVPFGQERSSNPDPSMAGRALGKLSGAARKHSKAAAEAARRNGAKGGRPKKQP